MLVQYSFPYGAYARAVAYLLCWLPFFTLNLLEAARLKLGGDEQPPEEDPTMALAFKLAILLGYCNSMLNPFIYTITNKDFRNVFKRILLRLLWPCN